MRSSLYLEGKQIYKMKEKIKINKHYLSEKIKNSKMNSNANA
jgi:hypothetical protein